MIPSLDYKNECDFSGTKLCYSNENINSKCHYPNYECSNCINNSNLIDGICRCNENYNGIGYIECIENECGYINYLFGKDKTYNCCENSGITCSNNNIVEM